MHLTHLNESKFRGDLFWHRLLLMDASFGRFYTEDFFSWDCAILVILVNFKNIYSLKLMHL